MQIDCHPFFCFLPRQINFEREPRRHFLTLLGYDPMELSKKVCKVMQAKLVPAFVVLFFF